MIFTNISCWYLGESGDTYFVVYYSPYKTPRPYIRNSDQQFHNWRRHQCSLSARCTGVYVKILKNHCFFVTNRACINLRKMFLKNVVMKWILKNFFLFFFFFTFDLLKNSYIKEIVTTAFYILRVFSLDVFLHV